MTMKKSVVTFFFWFLLGGWLVSETRVVPMPGLVNPDELQVYAGRLYVGEFPHVHIYSTGDFTPLNKIGRKGEGPREFAQYCVPIVAGKRLLVSSQGKVTLFSLDGEYLSEQKVNVPGGSFKPVGDYYGVYAYTRDGDIVYRAIEVYDQDFHRVKELYRFRLWWQEQGPLKGAHIIDSSRFRFKVSDHYLIWGDMQDFKVYIWDARRDRTKVVTGEHRPVKVTQRDIEGYHESLRRPANRRFYAQIKPHITFPHYFPPIKGMEVGGGRIYLYTYRTRGELTEFYIYHINGELITKTFLPLHGGIRPESFPFCFSNDQLYQLVESPDGEDWELRVTDIRL